MSGTVSDAARVLAARLERQFGRDAERAERLAYAQDRLIRANDRLWWGLHPDSLATMHGERPAVVDVAFAENRSEVLGAPDPLTAVQQAHCEHQEGVHRLPVGRGGAPAARRGGRRADPVRLA